MRRGGSVLGIETVKKIYDLSEEGRSSRQIGSELGISYTTAQQYIRLGKVEGLRKAEEIATALKPLPISLDDVKSDEVASEWLNSYEGTSRVPELGLQYFCNLVEKKPTELLEEAKSEIRGGKLLSERHYIHYLERFRQWLKKEGYAPITMLNYVSAIRAFYAYYYLEMPRLRKRKSNVIQPLEGNRNRRVRKEDIRDMLSVCRHLRDKAIVLVASSSGMGNAELRNLKVGHFWRGLDEEYEICKIRTVRVKTGLEFITFLSSEAVDMIWEYLTKERKIARDNIKTHLEEPLFAEVKDVYSRPDIYKPLSAGAMTLVFKNIAIRLDRYQPNTERTQKNIIQNELRSHNMRKFFNTELKNAGCPDQAVETMLAHKNGVKDAYYLEHEDELRTLYLKFMPALTIQPTETRVVESRDYKELKAENEVLRREMDNLKKMGERSTEFMDDFMKIMAEHPELIHRFKEFGASSKN
jgi:integrase